jgi:cardiolipin synthase
MAFLLAALSDFADGQIARRFGLTSKLGATLDPVADKLNMFVATAFLTWNGLLPLALGIAIITRDVVIVAGALAFRAVVGHLDVAPTWLSKGNTVLEFATLLLAMAVGATWIAPGPWLNWLFVALFTTVVASGVQYVVLWGLKALAATRAPR